MLPSLNRRITAHLLFWPLLILWTWKLVVPNPVPIEIRGLFWLDWLKIVAAKCLHASAYAFLIYVAGYLFIPTRIRLTIILVFMMLHGVTTEIIQTMVPNRTGKVTDVLIDWFGLALGVILGWKIWRIVFRR